VNYHFCCAAALGLPQHRLSLARPGSSAVSMYSAYINGPSLHFSQVPSLFHSHACPPPKPHWRSSPKIAPGLRPTTTHANAKPCSSLLPSCQTYRASTNTRMDGITRDESDGFAARGCLRYQTQDILIPTASIHNRAVHLRAAVIALRYMHVLRGQRPNGVDGEDPSSVLA
jgi:hypothetical protein